MTRICDAAIEEFRRTKKYPVCPQCGKEVMPMSFRDYVYKMEYKGRLIYFCNWNCMRSWQRPRGLTTEQLSQKALAKGEHFCNTYEENKRKKREERLKENVTDKRKKPRKIIQ